MKWRIISIAVEFTFYRTIFYNLFICNAIVNSKISPFFSEFHITIVHFRKQGVNNMKKLVTKKLTARLLAILLCFILVLTAGCNKSAGGDNAAGSSKDAIKIGWVMPFTGGFGTVVAYRQIRRGASSGGYQ